MIAIDWLFKAFFKLSYESLLTKKTWPTVVVTRAFS